MKTFPSFEYEQRFASQIVVGIDEAGRGPWAGPVVAAAVIVLDKEAFLNLFSEINDSKKLSGVRRKYFFDKLTEADCVLQCTGSATVEEIDSLNILNATLLAMRRAYLGLCESAAKTELPQITGKSIILVDGNKAIDAGVPCYPIIKGDSKSYSIASASIIAKVSRDGVMSELAKDSPQYHWEKNAGYGTKEHQEAIAKYGITVHHRKSYAPIAKLLRQAAF
ncbi:MAG: ribonuclease HII [Holosporales bacterium]|nr:ribonuclease HII [Holosporales bacterium]